MTQEMKVSDWKADILGDNYQACIIPLADDYQGKSIATLIRYSLPTSSKTAILYIHGFNDYFFQKEMGEQFHQQRYNFYALDLRGYGRSYLNHQKVNDIRDLKSYYEEINQALDIIRQENQKVVIMGHSTGGLIATLYAKDNTSKGRIDGVILNSPFYDFNLSPKIIKKLIPIVAFVGRIFPKFTINNVLNERYGRSLHKDYKGEWDYSLEWKPITAPPVSLGWIRAIYLAQCQLKGVILIHEPTLVLHSNRSSKNQINTTDIVLSVDDIDRVAHNIQGEVQIVRIEGGIHDLILSSKKVRERVYKVIFKWLTKI